MKQRFILILILAMLFLSFGNAQVLFLETFDEADDAITGTSNDAGMVAWSTNTPGSVAATDYFKVVQGVLEARDPNSPAATWTTDPIALNGCTGLEVSFQLSEVGALENCTDCSGTTGVLCIDWVKMEYRLDGGSWTDFSGETCDSEGSPGEMIQFGDIPGGGPILVNRPLCEVTAATLELRISVLTWAASEYWRIDDVTVNCNDCVILPVELNYFVAENQDKKVSLSWQTAAESGSSHFLVERSQDGSQWTEVSTVPAQETSTALENYSLEDNAPLPGTTHYRLKSVDMDNTFSYSAISTIIRSVDNDQLKFFPNPVMDYLTITGELLRRNKVEIFDLRGKRIEIDSPVYVNGEAMVRIDLRHLKSGIYLVKIGDILHRIRR